MTSDRETLDIIGSWMEDGRTRLPEHVLDAVLDRLPSTPQRRPAWSARRITSMNPVAKYAIAAAAVVVVAIAGASFLGRSDMDRAGGVAPTAAVTPSPPPSPTPSASPPPMAPMSGTIEAGRYRWIRPGGEVTFDLPAGWTGTPYGIVRNEDTPTHIDLAHYLPGTRDEVTHVYADACTSEGRLEPIDPEIGLAGALENQASTEAGTSWFNGPGGVADPPVGQRVEVGEEAGVDRSACRHGAEGPLQIWADADETTYFALAPGYRGLVYIFEVDGTPFVFTASLGPGVTEADSDAIDDIVRSFELVPH